MLLATLAIFGTKTGTVINFRCCHLFSRWIDFNSLRISKLRRMSVWKSAASNNKVTLKCTFSSHHLIIPMRLLRSHFPLPLTIVNCNWVSQFAPSSALQATKHKLCLEIKRETIKLDLCFSSSYFESFNCFISPYFSEMMKLWGCLFLMSGLSATCQNSRKTVWFLSSSR